MDEQIIVDRRSGDHDLLIELRTDVKNIGKDIKDIKDTTAAQAQDFEIRLRNLETWRWLVVGGFSLAMLGLTLYINYHG